MTVQPLDYLRAIRDDRELSSSERLVAIMIMSHAGPGGQRSHPGAKLLAAETGLSEKTVRAAAKKLEEKKWLVLTYSGKGGNRSKANEYALNIPTGNLTGLEDSPTGNQGSPTGNPDVPTGTDYPTDVLRNAPESASLSPFQPQGQDPIDIGSQYQPEGQDPIETQDPKEAAICTSYQKWVWVPQSEERSRRKANSSNCWKRAETDAFNSRPAEEPGVVWLSNTERINLGTDGFVSDQNMQKALSRRSNA